MAEKLQANNANSLFEILSNDSKDEIKKKADKYGKIESKNIHKISLKTLCEIADVTLKNKVTGSFGEIWREYLTFSYSKLASYLEEQGCERKYVIPEKIKEVKTDEKDELEEIEIQYVYAVKVGIKDPDLKRYSFFMNENVHEKWMKFTKKFRFRANLINAACIHFMEHDEKNEIEYLIKEKGGKENG